MNRSRAKRRFNAWWRYAQRARQLSPNWWEDDASTNGFIRAHRRWRWYPGAYRSDLRLPWNTDENRPWAKGMPASFVRKIIKEAADLQSRSNGV